MTLRYLIQVNEIKCTESTGRKLKGSLRRKASEELSKTCAEHTHTHVQRPASIGDGQATKRGYVQAQPVLLSPMWGLHVYCLYSRASLAFTFVALCIIWVLSLQESTIGPTGVGCRRKRGSCWLVCCGTRWCACMDWDGSHSKLGGEANAPPAG